MKENLKPFPKGKSGNPKGRPKKLPELDKMLIEELGKDYRQGMTVGQKIIAALAAKAMRGDTKAADILLDRGYGKVKQDVNIKGTVDITKQSVSFE